MEKKSQTKQQKITDYIDDTPLLSPADIEWKIQHEAKVKSGKGGGTDPIYRHLPHYPTTLSGKQICNKLIVDKPQKVDLTKIYLSPITTTVPKKQKQNGVN